MEREATFDGQVGWANHIARPTALQREEHKMGGTTFFFKVTVQVLKITKRQVLYPK